MSPALMWNESAWRLPHRVSTVHPYQNLTDGGICPHLRVVEMRLREVSALIWGHTASKDGSDLPQEFGFHSQSVESGKAWGVVSKLQDFYILTSWHLAFK